MRAEGEGASGRCKRDTGGQVRLGVGQINTSGRLLEGIEPLPDERRGY